MPPYTTLQISDQFEKCLAQSWSQAKNQVKNCIPKTQWGYTKHQKLKEIMFDKFHNSETWQ